MKKILSNNPEWLPVAVKALTRGELVIYPTETSYGLGADATNPAAIEKLLAYKGNRLNKALSVAIADIEMARKYIEMNETANNVFNTLLPGPVTVIAKSRGKVAAKVESERKTLGIRYSNLPLVSELVKKFGKPITATSANTSGIKQIFSFEEWQKYVSVSRQKMTKVFIDAGKLPVRSPSTVVDTTLESPEILRQGEIVLDEAATNFISYSEIETVNLGAALIHQQQDQLATHPLVVALQGDLGAGKTQFAKGIGKALGITETINSPTYTLMKEYVYQTKKSRGMFYHIDTWRLFEGEVVSDLGIEFRMKAGDVIAIEWQQKANDWIKKLKTPITIAWIDITKTSETSRKIKVKWEYKQ